MALTEREKLGWIVSGLIYGILFCVFAPFLILGTIEILDATYDINKIGAQGLANTVANSPYGVDASYVFTAEMAAAANKTVESIGLFSLGANQTTVVGSLTLGLSEIFGGYAIALYSNVPLTTDNVINAIVTDLSIPLVTTYTPLLLAAGTPQAQAAVYGQIYGNLTTWFLTRFGTADIYFSSIAAASATAGLQPFFDAETVKEMVDAAIIPQNSAELTALLDTVYGGSIQLAFGIPSYDLMILHVTPYSDEVFDQSKNILKVYIIPPIVIAFVIMIIVSIFVFYFRQEPEIRSKYEVFLIYLFSILYFNSIFYLVCNILLLDLIKHRIALSIMASILHFCYPLFFSALNCRHRMMYCLFIKKEKKTNFFFPLLWYTPMFVVVFLAMYFGLQSSSEYSIDMRYAYIPYMLVTVFITVEGLFYTYQTRHSWDMFVDTHYNLRSLGAYIICAIPVFVLLYIYLEPSIIVLVTLVFSFFCTYLPSCYLLDSFLLPVLKIIFRNRGVNVFGSMSFEAQKENGNGYGTINGILQDKKLRALLLRFSMDNHCDENVRFLIDLESLKADLTKDKFEKLYTFYCMKRAVDQLNLSFDCQKTCETGYERVKSSTLATVTKDQVVFAFNQAEIEITNLITENLLKDFLQSEAVQNVLKEKDQQSQFGTKLASLGLVSVTTASMMESSYNEQKFPSEGNRPPSSVDQSFCVEIV